MDNAPKERNELFYYRIQIGDLALLNNIPEAIAIFGDTKAGKTSSSHILANNPMRADVVKGSLFWTPPEQSRYSKCKVGSANTQSETQVPNVFEDIMIQYKHNETKITLIDTPGYGDTEGFYRIFANGYFHYRVFSRTPNLKFIIAFPEATIDEGATAQVLKKVIKNFLSAFKNYTPESKLAESILKATVFMVTKVSPKIDKPRIVERLNRFIEGREGQSLEQKCFIQMVKHMIDNDKIFLIHKPASAGDTTEQNNILSDICNKTDFWVRKTKNDVVSMEQINFSIGKIIYDELVKQDKRQFFKEELTSFMQYTAARIKNLLTEKDKNSFRSIFNTLMADTIGSNMSRKFIQEMENVVNSYYPLFSNEKQFVEKREKLVRSMFKINEDETSVMEFQNEEPVKKRYLIPQARISSLPSFPEKDKKTSSSSRYFLKKFAVFEEIIQKFTKIGQQVAKLNPKKSMQSIQEISYNFKQILKSFNKLKKSETESFNVIQKYGYLIHRCLEEGKILNSIIKAQNLDIYKKLKENNILTPDIIASIKDEIIVQIEGISPAEMKEKYIKDIQIEKLDAITEEVVTFFESCKLPDIKTNLNVAKLVLANAQDKKTSKSFAILKLMDYRQNLIAAYQEYPEENDEKLCISDLILEFSSLLGQILYSQGMYSEAKDVFSSVKDVEQVIRCFEKEVQEKIEKKDELKTLYLNFGEYASAMCRDELAVSCYQKAYSICKATKERSAVAEKIVEESTQNKSEAYAQYLSDLHGKTLFDHLSGPTQRSIKDKYTNLKK